MAIDFEARHAARRTEFFARIEREGLNAAARDYIWYHTVDLGEGLVTPGIFDYRGQWAEFGLPEQFNGATVLDAGPATGYFTFEFARRGARTTCFDLPSLRALDRFPGQSVEHSLEQIERMMESASPGAPRSETAFYEQLIDGPFRFCQQRLGAQVARCYSTIYDATRTSLNAPAGFDYVYAGDILLHLLYPLKALAALAELTRGTLVIVERCPGEASDAPAMLYKGGADPNADEVNWWLMNRACLEQCLLKLGFREVREVGKHTAVVQSSGFEVERTVLHAIR